ncbi:MAG: hypothetical protein JW936_01900 [Sedimentisphaerales bacterium]|nr:hypothetical protein [Sedimentisphaerales bacterium]
MTPSKKLPPRLKRADSFLGIHFDFHAGDDCKTIGKTVTPKMIQNIIDQVHPDYIQCDCKGHPGFSSYPTKVGYPAPGFVKDQLRIWRNVTARNGVALFMHYSGVWDTKALKHHPSWARVDENGKRDPNNASVFGPYVDELLIPQFKELSDVYGVDGVWIDGDCWATCQDYHKNIIKAFQQKTGIRNIPKKPTDPHFFEFTEFCRQGFRDYVNHYVTEMHKHNPDFQIASNWSYTSFMPEPVNIDVDFISGDYPLVNSVNAARFEARAIAPQGKPWDLMAWSFGSRWKEGCFTTKTIPQLQQEAAIVLATGGGFQAYFQQNRDGSIAPWQMKLMAETAKFCRDRQKLCHHAKAVPQIALLNSAHAFYRNNIRVFSPWEGILESIRGILISLLDSQNSVEVLSEHHLENTIDQYPLLILPETNCLAAKTKKQIIKYVENGGKLLLIGPASAKLFKKEIGVKFLGKPEERIQWIEHNDWLAGLKTESQYVKLQPHTKALGKIYPQNNNIGPYYPAASVRKLGKGKIAAIYLNLGQCYERRRTTIARDFLNHVVSQLFTNPIVQVTGSHYVDVNVNTINGKLAVNLINTAGPHSDENVYSFDDIPALGPLEINIRYPRKPNKVTIQPQNRKLRHTYTKGKIQLTLPKLKIHSIITVE